MERQASNRFIEETNKKFKEFDSFELTSGGVDYVHTLLHQIRENVKWGETLKNKQRNNPFKNFDIYQFSKFCESDKKFMDPCYIINFRLYSKSNPNVDDIRHTVIRSFKDFKIIHTDLKLHSVSQLKQEFLHNSCPFPVEDKENLEETQRNIVNWMNETLTKAWE